jgi:hypothetical protein
MSSIDIALFVADKLFDLAKGRRERDKLPEILVTQMFYKRRAFGPAMWEFDEDTFLKGMPVKVINNSSSKHFTISFFRLHTVYAEGKRSISKDHARIPLDEAHKNHDLAPGHAAEFSLPWETVMLSANESRTIETRDGVKDLLFTLNFHDDYDNVDYSSKPLDSFLIRSEGSRIVHVW